MTDLLLLKLGGSMLTDKRGVEAARPEVLAQVGAEVAAARAAVPGLRLVLGHGSGSFGHVAASRYGTRQGVHSAGEWRGFAEVSAAAARLNRLVQEALLAAGVPALSLPPSASAVCVAGEIESLAVRPVELALAARLVPLVYGDVAFDVQQGGTIISTEEILSYLAGAMQPQWLLLAGQTEGVYDQDGRVIPLITPQNFPAVRQALGGSEGTDVTGGMASKVQAMLGLAAQHPHLSIRIFSGLVPGQLKAALSRPEAVTFGTLIRGGEEHRDSQS